MEERLEGFLKEKKLELIEKISKGYSSEIYLVRSGEGEKFALKIEKEKSPREEMVKKEVGNLRLANSIEIGPTLLGFDEKRRIILMEYIDGITFNKWLFEKNPSKEQLEKFLEELFRQAKELDAAALDHGQLAGKGKNILVRKGKPVIVDFEKASKQRRPHNETQLESFIYRNPFSAITGRIKEILEEK